MEEIQQSKLIFFIPLMAGYASASLISYFLFLKFGLISKKEIPKTKKSFSELIYILIAIIGIFILGRIYSAGYLIPSKFNPMAWIINNLIIYSPIFIILIFRKQSTVTIWISFNKWYLKLAFGVLASIVALSIFLILRSEWHRWPEIIEKSISIEGLSYFPAVFLEGVALAFIFVRLKWVFNLKFAITIPALLFALAHLPRAISNGDPWWDMLFFSIINGTITVYVLYTCDRTKDIIWIGLVHYFLDVATNAF